LAERKVTITNDWTYRKIRTVILENEYLKLTVLPEIGAKIYDIIYKPQQKNLLWHNPRIPPMKAPFGAAFDDVWSGGWDEIFPNDAPCNYDGERYPDMGEVWSIPWNYSVSRTEERPQAVTLVTSVTSPITPCKLTRTLTLKEGEASIHLQYALENLSHTSLKFLWKLHPALAINETCSIEIPASRGIIDPRYRHLYSETSTELTYLFITHDLGVARYIATRVAVMYHGKIVEITNPDELIAHPLHHYTKLLLASIPGSVLSEPSRQSTEYTFNPAEPPKGCRFHPRCAAAKEKCSTEEPTLTEIRKDHFVSCHYPLAA